MLDSRILEVHTHTDLLLKRPTRTGIDASAAVALQSLILPVYGILKRLQHGLSLTTSPTQSLCQQKDISSILTSSLEDAKASRTSRSLIQQVTRMRELYFDATLKVGTMVPIHEPTSCSSSVEGTSIILHGVPGKQDLDVSFDGHDAEDAFREIPESGSDWNWNLSYDFLVSPPLEDRPHTIEFGQDDSSFQDIPRIDHAYVSPGRNTFLRGRSMMVDDPLLEYRDRWTEYPISSIFPRRQELGFDLPAGTFHACDAPGCTAVLEFFGAFRAS